MRTSFLLFLLIVSFLPFHSAALSFSVILQAAKSALTFIETIVDVFTTSEEEKQLEDLTKEMSSLKQNLRTELNSLLATLHENSYKTVLTVHTDKIESCEKDYFNYVSSSSNATLNYLKKCNNIIDSVRTLSKYLYGEAIFASPPLFDLYKDKGVCDGYAIDNIFKYLFADLVVGCTIASTIELLEHGPNMKLYENDCKHRMSKVKEYVKSLYHDCAISSCKTFHKRVQELVMDSSPTSPKDLYENLSGIYPWFNFLVFQFSLGGKATASGNFSIAYDGGHWISRYQYDIFFFDANLQIKKEKEIYSLTIEVHEKFYVGHYFGKSIMAESMAAGSTFRIFQGFAQKTNNLFSCNTGSSGNVVYIRGEESSENRNIGTSDTLFPRVSVLYCILCFVFVLVN